MLNPKETFFSAMPGAALQLHTLQSGAPYGVESDDDTQAFQAHSSAVPLISIASNLLPCGGGFRDKLCFDGMSEHLGDLWREGSGDSWQPNFLAWTVSPKACLLKGAATSIMGGSDGPPAGEGPTCSMPMKWLRKFPPSQHSACNGWGLFYPRSGTITGPSNTIGALMVASRIKSLSTEVFHSEGSSLDEIWQMLSPQSSSCFREGQNLGILELGKNVTELGRLRGKRNGYLFSVWKKVTCCRDLAQVPAAYATLQVLKTTCSAMGGQ